MATLEYEPKGTKVKAPPPRWVYWLALVFCVCPAVAGVGITVLYLLTWWGALQVLGLVCMLAGLVSVGVAAVLLGVYGVGQWRYGTMSKNRLGREIVLAGLLLVANFPLAVVCVFVGMDESSKVLVTFVNETSGPVTAVTLISNGVPTVVGDLPAKSQRKVTVRVTSVSGVKGSATTGGVATEFVINGGMLDPISRTVRFQTLATPPVME